MKLNEIQDLIKFVAKSGVSEVEVETKDIKIIMNRIKEFNDKTKPVSDYYRQSIGICEYIDASQSKLDVFTQAELIMNDKFNLIFRFKYTFILF